MDAAATPAWPGMKGGRPRRTAAPIPSPITHFSRALACVSVRQRRRR